MSNGFAGREALVSTDAWGMAMGACGWFGFVTWPKKGME